MSTRTSTRASGLDGFFKISECGSSMGREVRGGIVTFFTMGYIIVLNPLILGFAPDVDGNYPGGGTGDGSNLAAITVGIGAGFLAYVLIKVVRGKAAEVHTLMWVVAALFLVYFAISPITDWLT